MKRPKIELPLRIVLLYLLFGGLWILLSDQILFLFVFHDVQETIYQTLKGWFFILVSGVLLHILLRMDLAGRKRAEQQTIQMKRLYATLSQVNQTIVRVKDQGELYKSICDVAVQFGEFQLAWIGLLDESTGEVRPVAANGLDINDWPFPVLNIHTGPLADGMIAQSIRASSVITSEDILTEERLKALHHGFMRQGFHSAAIVPFQVRGKVIGTLSLLSQEKGLFKVMEELRLLEEMGLDISFALDMMQKEAERERADAQLRYQAHLLENVNDAIVGSDAQYILRAWNLAAERIYGWKAEEVLGKNSVDILQTRFLEVDADEMRRRIGELGRYVGEATQLRKDGTRIRVEVASMVLQDGSGKITGYVSVNRDITYRQQAEEALRENEERLRLSLQAANQGLYDLNVQTGNTVVNREYAQMLGYDPETFVETNAAWIERLHPDDRERVAKAYSDYISGSLPEYRVEFRQRMKDGNWKWILSLGKVIEYDAEGKPLRMLGTHTDITEHRRAEEEIQSRSRQLAALLEASQSLTESLNLAEVLQKITDKAAEVLGTEKTAIYLLEGEYLYLGASTPPLPPDFPETMRRASLADHPHIAEALAIEQPVILPDAAFTTLTAAERLVSDALRLRTIIYLPLVASKKATGVLILGSVAEPRDFSRNDRDVARALSNQAELAIANAKLYENLSLYVKELENQISERKQAEEALRASEERFRLLFENNHTVMMLIDPASGVIKNANAAAAEFYGYPLVRLRGMNINEINTLSPDEVHAERMRALTAERNFFNFQHRLSSGEIRSVEVHSAPVEVDEKTLLYSIIHDITERRQADEKLRRHIGYLTGLREVDQAIASSFDVRLSLSIITSRAVPLLNVDAAAILLLDPIMNSLEYAAEHGFTKNLLHTGSIRLGESYAGRVVMERRMIQVPRLANEQHTQAHHQFLQQEKFVSYFGIPLIVKGKVVGVMEIFHRTFVERDQEWFDFLDSLAGQPAIAIDNARLWEQVQRHARELERRVAERTAALNRTNAELEHANRAKDEFLANMSHELRTPLNSILGLSESLLEQRRDPLTDYQQKSLQIISSSGHHLLELINDVLDLSKIEAGKFDHYPQSIDVNTLCRSSLSFVRSLALKKSITIDYDNETSVSNISADPRRLKQILVNLLTNAVKFTPEQGGVTLRVSADAEQDLIQFSVIDNGIGIAPQDLKRLFQPFVQVDSKLNRQFEGTGLGLALVQKLTDLHGGSVEVESEVGVGSRFTVNLPWKQENEPLREFIKADGEPAFPDGSHESVVSMEERPEHEVVLLAEDNIANTLTIAQYLESHGYSIVKAHDGLEAIEKAEEHDPNVILMDIQMPVMDGMEAIRRLRANSRFARTPIIAITALAMPGDRERCLEAGADDYMSKPVRLKMLMKTMAKLTGHPR